MALSQSDQIIAQLATLAEGMAGFRREVADQMAGVRRDIERQDQVTELERQESHLSRKELHEKVNDISNDVGVLKGDVRVAAATSAQTRDTVEGLTEAVNKAAPTIAQIEQAKRFGQWILTGGAVAAVGTAIAAVAWGEALKATLAHWLGIK